MLLQGMLTTTYLVAILSLTVHLHAGRVDIHPILVNLCCVKGLWSEFTPLKELFCVNGKMFGSLSLTRFGQRIDAFASTRGTLFLVAAATLIAVTNTAL